MHMKRFVFLAPLVLTAACAQSPLGPSTSPAVAPTARTTVAVLVATRDTHAPLAGASVTCFGAGCTAREFTTDATGFTHMDVIADKEFTIYAEANGYADFYAGVDGLVAGAHETWTFYLERQQ